MQVPPGFTGVTPDIVCLAKAIGGGIASAAVGGSAEVMEHVAERRLRDGGHLQRQPARDGGDARHADRGRDAGSLRAPRGAGREIDTRARPDHRPSGLPAHVVSVGAKGCVTFAREPVRNYRDFLEVDDRYNHAHWLFQHNGGVFLPPWGKTEQWLISVQHDDDGHRPVRRELRTFRGRGRASEASAASGALRDGAQMVIDFFDRSFNDRKA